MSIEGLVTHAADLAFADLVVGRNASHEYLIDPSCHRLFVDVFADRSPVHVDEAYARDAGFDGLVMHGAILNGFLSHFVGMVLPGRRALLQSVDMRYAAPSYLGDTLRIDGTVAQRVDSVGVVVLNVVVTNVTRGVVAGRARAQVGVRGA